MTLDLGRIGIWSPSFTWPHHDGQLTDDALETAAELDKLGFGALWLGSSAPALDLPEQLLAATSRIVVATGIVNMWTAEPDALAASYHRLAEAHPNRFLLGLGAGHAANVPDGREYTRPLSYLAGFLDGLDAAPRPVPADSRILAALRQKALRLGGERSLGAHPYLITPEHTHLARGILGAGPLLAPEQKVALATDPAQARALARATVAYYLRLPNYVNNLRALGFTDDDLTDGGSDRLVDGLVAWGSPDQVARRVTEHLDAGADHVVLQVVVPGAHSGALARDDWRTLAAALL